MPSDEMVKLWSAMLTSVPGWIILASMVLFFGFVGFKIFVGTYSERLLAKVVATNHQELVSTIHGLSESVQGLQKTLDRALSSGGTGP